MGLFSSRSSTAVNETNNNFYDQRSVIDAGGGIVGEGISVDRSQAFNTSNSGNTTTSTTINNQAVDPGLVAVQRLNTEFLRAAADGQSDTVRLLANMGAQTVRDSGGAATELFSLGFQNSARAWENTLDAGTRLMGQMLTGAEKTTQAAQSVATTAIGAFQPGENKQSEAVKWIGLAAVGVVALLLLRRA